METPADQIPASTGLTQLIRSAEAVSDRVATEPRVRVGRLTGCGERC